MKKYFYIISIIVLLGFSACCSSEDKNIVFDRGVLPNESLQVYPYALNDVFALKNAAGKSITFTVTKKAKESKQDIYKPNVKGGCERTETTNYEMLTSEITSDSSYLNIRYICSNEIGQVANSLSINFTGFAVPININVKEPKEYAYNYLPSYTVNAVVYNDVFELTTNSGAIQENKPKFVYYNFEYGIIQIVTTKGDKYSL